MPSKSLATFCVLIILLTGFVGCIPVSADPVETEGETLLMGYHTTIYSLWRVNWYDCDFGGWPAAGTHISGAFYNSYLMITEAYQSQLRIKTVNGGWSIWSFDAATCQYYQGTDSQGRTLYGSKFTWTNIHVDGGIYTLYYTPAFALTSTSIYLYQTFRWSKTSGPGIANLTGWWKTFYPQGTVYKNGQILTKEKADQPVYWVSEKFYKDARHYMYTDSYGFGGPNGYFTEGWAAFQTIENYNLYYENANGQTLTYPSGGDFIDIDNNGYTLLTNSDYYFCSIWVATATD
jgi:hypothetical protein